MARQRWYQHPEEGNHELVSEEEYFKLKAKCEEDKHAYQFDNTFLLKGKGFPSKDIEMKNKQQKALRKNPNHTTLNDYKFGRSGSVPEKARKKNKKRLKKKGVKVKNYGEK